MKKHKLPPAPSEKQIQTWIQRSRHLEEEREQLDLLSKALERQKARTQIASYALANAKEPLRRYRQAQQAKYALAEGKIVVLDQKGLAYIVRHGELRVLRAHQCGDTAVECNDQHWYGEDWYGEDWQDGPQSKSECVSIPEGDTPEAEEQCSHGLRWLKPATYDAEQNGYPAILDQGVYYAVAWDALCGRCDYTKRKGPVFQPIDETEVEAALAEWGQLQERCPD